MTHNTNDSITRYLHLAAQRPELFRQSEQVPIVLNEEMMREFAASSSKPVGLLTDNSPFYYLVGDVCIDEKGQLFRYCRVIYCAEDNGVVIVPRREDGKIGLLRLFRHIPRTECLEFPRGFSKAGQTAEENARRELYEELGAKSGRMTHLGSVRADTGLAAGCAEVFLAEVDGDNVRIGHEGIMEVLWLDERELACAIAVGGITDGFTLSALTLLRCRRELKGEK